MTTAINHTHNDNQDLKGAALNNQKAHQRAVPSNLTKGLKAVIAEIDDLENQRNPGNTRVITKDGLSRVYLYKDEDSFCAAGYKRRLKDPRFRYSFNTQEERDQYVMEWIKERVEDEKHHAKKARTLEIGDVLCSSWGWEQTNVNYYLVTKLIGKTMVELIEVEKHQKYSGNLSLEGACTPDTSKTKREPFKRKVNNNRVTIDKGMYAKKVEYTEVEGVRQYKEEYFSSYH